MTRTVTRTATHTVTKAVSGCPLAGWELMVIVLFAIAVAGGVSIATINARQHGGNGECQYSQRQSIAHPGPGTGAASLPATD